MCQHDLAVSLDEIYVFFRIMMKQRIPVPVSTECVTDLDYQSEMINVESLQTTFEASVISIISTQFQSKMCVFMCSRFVCHLHKFFVPKKLLILYTLENVDEINHWSKILTCPACFGDSQQPFFCLRVLSRGNALQIRKNVAVRLFLNESI